MNSTATHPDTVQLIRAGKDLRDPKREACVYVHPPATSLLPPIFVRKPFVVPYGNLAVPIDMDGKPIRARVHETHDDIYLYPEIRIVGVEQSLGDRLAGALYHALDRQLPELRERIDGIFRAELGLHPSTERLDRVRTSAPDAAGRRSHEAEEILSSIRAQLGLLVSWVLEPEPAIASWMKSLMRATPKSETLTFNDELPDTEFKLTFSLTIERVELPSLHKAKRRAEGGFNVAGEISRLFQRAYEITSPAFRAALVGLNVWNSEIVRELASQGFSTTVAKRLADEFGYRVKFSDFSPQPNRAMIEAIKKVSSPELLNTSLEARRGLVLSLEQSRAEALRLNDGMFDSPEIERFDRSLEQARKELTQAEKAYLQGHQPRADRLAELSDDSSNDLKKRFQKALELENAKPAANES